MVRLTTTISLVGSGEVGLSDPDDCHVYLLDGGDEYALIDAGCGSAQSIAALLQTLVADGLESTKIRKILLTHWHFDHAGGAGTLRERFGCEVIAPAGERAFIEQGRDGVPACIVDRAVCHGEQIQVGALTVTAHCVPGHSEATTGYLVDTPEGRAFFAGDIVYSNGILGLINYPGSDLAQYRAHLGSLAGLMIDALLPGHLLFTLGAGQRHIDLAIHRLQTDGFVPYSIGQLGAAFVPARGFV